MAGGEVSSSLLIDANGLKSSFAPRRIKSVMKKISEEIVSTQKSYSPVVASYPKPPIRLDP